MNSSRISNAKRNVVWAGVNKVTAILLPFLVRTVLIYSLGVNYLGIGGLFGSILQVLSLAELGFASAIVYSLYKPIAQNDNETICALLNFYKKVYSVVGMVILAGGIILIPFLKYLVDFQECPKEINLYIIYLVYLLNTALGYFLFAYKKSLLIAYQRKEASDKANTISALFVSIFQIMVLLTTQNYYLYVIILPLGTFIDNVLCAHKAKRLFPNAVCKYELKKEQKIDIIEKTKGLLVYKVCGVTRNSLDNIFISMFLGITTVGLYSNYYYIMSSIRTFLDVLTTSVSAGIGDSVAVESVEKNYNNLRVFTFLYEWICGWCTVCLLCLYQPFMEIWLGKDNMLPFSIVVSLCIYFYVWTAGDMRSQYTDATGLWWKEKKRSVAETIGNVVLNYVMIQIWGVNGVVLATAISIFVIGIPWSTKIIFKNYFKGESATKYLATQLIYALSTVFACVVTYSVCSFVDINGIVGLVVRAMICILVPNICFLLCYFKTKIGREAFVFVKTRVS